MTNWKTTIAGLVKGFTTIGTVLSLATGQPTWVTILGGSLLGIAQVVGGFVQADAKPS